MPIHIVSTRFTVSEIEVNRQRYELYEKCLRSREAQWSKFGSRQQIEAIRIQQGSSLKLHLSPDAQERIEDMWKPNGGYLSQKAQSAVYSIKKTLRELVGLSDQMDGNLTISWEHMPLKSEAKWTPVLNLTEPSTFSEKFKVIAKDVFKGESKTIIGSLYELEVQEANYTRAGWYRCIQRTNKTSHISRVFYVDVFKEIGIQMRLQSDINVEERIIEEFPDLRVVAVERPGLWTKCNKCGSEVGERFRRVECILKMQNSELINKRFQFLSLFHFVHCHSSLVPSEIRKQLHGHIDIEEVQKCTVECPPILNETRVIEQLNNIGEREVVDEIPPGEFTLKDRLPPLKPAVDRHVVNKIEGDSLVLDCGVIRRDEEKTIVFWHYDFEPLDATNLTAYSKNDRLTIRGTENRIVFRELKINDHGLYSCFVPPYQLVRTFRLYVAEGDRTAELMSLVQLSVRFTAVFLLVVLIIAVVTSTDARTESRRAAA
ncbi:hypothetical protein M3Y96_00398700 [Aphelenchoides besseyi]|nr:hypothetical protein M3Y96_00398700 [Aphelenchoides besseyi]